MPSTLTDAHARLLARLAAATAAAGRPEGEVRLLAVTKGVSDTQALGLFELGQRDFGESRADGLERRAQAFRAALGERAAQVRWHFIGPLQSNKARRVLRHCDVLHSLDRAELVDVLERLAAERGRPLDVFLQVKLRAEETKGGLQANEVPAVLERVARAAFLRPLGLMALAPWIEDEDARRREARAVFEELARLSQTLAQTHFAGGRCRLSMGMSGDLEEAVAAGSDWVRVGSALFVPDDTP